MSIISKVDLLDKNICIKCMEFLDKCKLANFSVMLNETRRDIITQLLYYHQGRLDTINPDIVSEFNRLRKRFGFWELSKREALSSKITWTFESKHIDGNAFDAVPMKEGKPWWTAPKEVWEQMGKIGESCGLVWGGRWERKDYPHFEI